jgi:serine phosphatase RsbU (regulator of sigma subunit)
MPDDPAPNRPPTIASRIRTNTQRAIASVAERRSAKSGCELLVLFTDGMTDARDRFDQRFGEDAVLEVVNAHRGAPPRVIVEQVLARLQQHTGDVMRRDDLTMVIARA